MKVPVRRGSSITSMNSFDYWEKKGRLDFGMFVIVVSWLLVIIMVALFVTGLHEKITIINWPLTVSEVCCVLLYRCV